MVDVAPPLTVVEHQQILHDWKPWNSTRVEFPEVCAHALFEQQVLRTPEAPAIIYQEQTLSYRQLNERANQLAHALRRRGFGAESLVGICLERTPEMVVALLGTWKAGAAYVPLDPSYPPERLAFMVRDAGLRLLLGDSQSRPLFAGDDVETLCLDADATRFAAESSANPTAAAKPENLAYVMYTSGSTGQPKGVMIEHRGLVNYLCWAVKAYGLAAGESVPVHSSLAFDLTVTSLYPPLLVGGHVLLLPPDAGAQNLLAALQQGERKNLVKITPAHLEVISRQLDAADMARASRIIVIGGENLFAENLRPWRQHAPETRLINEYGPTETVVGCCVHEVRPDDPQTGPVAIGRPIANTRLYVLDAALQPVPVGATGELFIGGIGVGRGYLNRPDLTRERFLDDPFADEAGARMYRSGDLARYRADGTLEYLGRTDSQVKLRGFRIELAEIEAQLAAHPAVRTCAVLMREDQPGDRQLVAYACLNAAADTNPANPSNATNTTSANQLQERLKACLPDYMVPAHFVLLDDLPLTPNGKVDRQALPAPAAGDAVQSAAYEPPRTSVEMKLATIYRELFKVGQVGLHDDFFDLGGHSLLAIKAISRIRDVFRADLKIQTLFTNPTIAGLAQALAAAGIADDGPMRIRAGQSGHSGTDCPLSLTQEHLWFLDRLIPGNPAYNIIDMIQLAGPFHRPALKQALQELVRRHEQLRTVFAERNGQGIQSVLPAAEVALAEYDLSSLPQPEREDAWRRLVGEQGNLGFDLCRAPPLRWTVVHLSAHEHRLLLVLHHIIADEWSMDLIQNEVRQLYAAFSLGGELFKQPPNQPPFAELPIQYADFACWQREWMRGEVLEKQLAYWRSELAGAPAAIDLPIDKPRPAGHAFCGACETFELPPSLLQRMNALGQKAQATLFMVLEAAFATLLHRYTGQDDILVGSPITRRGQSETEQLVGYFLNTVILRSRFRDGMSFRSLLQQVRERALAAYAHADAPFSRLVAELAPERVPGQSPLFQVIFVVHAADSASRVSQLTGERHLRNASAKFDLSLELAENGGRLQGLIEYRSDLFAAATIRRMCGHYARLLEAIADDPDGLVSRLPLLTDGERDQLAEWNRTTVANAGDGNCLHRLIEAQVKRTPERTAVVCGPQTLTYDELNRRANRLARYLRAQGAGPGTLVGIDLERSPDLVVGLLAIMKSGAAYVPLDPTYPAQRLAGIIEDADAALLLTESALRDTLPASNARLVCLDELAATLAAYPDKNLPDKNLPDENLPDTSNADDLCYVIFTSGSTGRPKGVALTHRALVNLLESMGEAPGLGADDIMLSVTSISFDIATLELYLPLLKGAKTVVVSRDEALDGKRLLTSLTASAATVMQATPATWRLLIACGWQGSPGLKVLCGGEALTRELADQLLSRAGEVWNLYGPTETTVWSSAWRVEAGDGCISIGRPIANTQLWVVDAELQPVPVGAIGELCIGGVGVARGYWRRPELTAEKFVADPFADSFANPASARLYHTGDLARWLPDGRLECLGRIDHQVKIRGYRIELGEVEASIARHPAVRAVVAVAREGTDGEKQLLAYFVAENPPAGLADELRTLLRATLPEYMVPAQFIMLDALPLTHNGKVDRQALPAPTPMAASLRNDPASIVAPRTGSETLILGIFRDVLGRNDFGVLDSFFDLGGHSLMATRIVSRIQDESGIDLPLRNLFERPTVAGLAEIVDSLTWLARSRGTAPLVHASDREEIAL